tara:strand:- start:995 stop:1642 length:648 start_codon:yes stop_codon:yes gene_type:complete
MTLTIRPELGVPLGEEESVLDLKDRTEAASNTALELAEHGLDIEPTKEDKDIASKLAVAYAADPEKVSKKASSKKVSKLPPASLILTNQILQEFGHSVAESATQIRHLVTNKLLIESENADPRIRVRALELLGKISDVGLFSEKSEVTITHQSTDDLREKLRSKLEKLVNPVDDIEEAEFMDAEPIDVDEELGMPDEEEEVEEEYDDEEECPSQP